MQGLKDKRRLLKSVQAYFKGRIERLIRRLRVMINKQEGRIEKRVKMGETLYNKRWHTKIEAEPEEILNDPELLVKKGNGKRRVRRIEQLTVGQGV